VESPSEERHIKEIRERMDTDTREVLLGRERRIEKAVMKMSIDDCEYFYCCKLN
jgi:hypothetical protein